jgi:phosphoglucosamine mutase
MQNVFGTDGVRGKFGTGFFVQEHLETFARAFCEWLIHTKQRAQPRILLVHDTRSSCAPIKTMLFNGMQHYSATIFDAGVLPTPAALHVMKTGLFDAGIIISASHNPWYDNGIKIVDRSGKLTEADELLISGYYEAHKSCCASSSLQAQMVPYDGFHVYVDQVMQLTGPLDLTSTKIVLDCAHGAMYRVAPEVMRLYGAQVVVLHNAPTGQNINDNCGALHPESLQKAVVEQHADIGFAFDGDGDRLIVVNREGAIKDGDDILSVLMQLPAYKDQAAVVGTVMSNEGFVQFCARQGKKLLRAAVGDKYVVERLIAENLFLGGEPAGHIIMRDLIPSGDGLLVALQLLKAMRLNKQDLVQTFHKFPQVTINVGYTVPRAQFESAVKALAAEAQKSLLSGRVLIRFSGTEPLIRIMVEAESKETCQKLAEELKKKVLGIITGSDHPE